MVQNILVGAMGVIAVAAVVAGWWYETHGKEDTSDKQPEDKPEQ